MNKIVLKAKEDNWSVFCEKVEDLTKISDIVKFKFDSQHIFMYALIGDSMILAMKSYILKLEDYFDTKDIGNMTIDHIVYNAKKWIKNLSIFNIENGIYFKLDCKEINETLLLARTLTINDNRVKIISLSGELSKFRDLSKYQQKILLDPNNIKWSFKMSPKDLADIKKLSSMNSDEKIINISSTAEGVVSASEGGRWSLEIDKIENGGKIIFGKKYLSNINSDGDVINFYIYDTFILFKEKEKSFMMSFEQSFEDDI